MAKNRLAGAAQTAKYGIALGVAGGFAEIIWIAAYGSLAGSDTTEVARAITSTVGRALPGISLASAPFIYGIVIHMLAAVGMGIALVLVWQGLTTRGRTRFNVYTFMVGALALIWVFNFFVVLPLISPAFVEIVPYPASFVSKLLFGLAGAIMLRYVTTRAVDRGDPIRASDGRTGREG